MRSVISGSALVLLTSFLSGPAHAAAGIDHEPTTTVGKLLHRVVCNVKHDRDPVVVITEDVLPTGTSDPIAAPEIDAAGAALALTLVAGIVAIRRERHRAR